MNFHRYSFSCLVLIFIFLVRQVAIGQEARTWSSADGKFQVEATLVQSNSESVQLRRSDNGKLIAVPIGRLSNDDRKYVKSFNAASVAAKKKQAEPKPVEIASKPDESAPTSPVMDIPPDDIMKMVVVVGKYEEYVTDFRDNRAKKLAQQLRKIDYRNGLYDSTVPTLSYEIDGEQLRFSGAEGSWRLMD